MDTVIGGVLAAGDGLKIAYDVAAAAVALFIIHAMVK